MKTARKNRYLLATAVAIFAKPPIGSPQARAQEAIPWCGTDLQSTVAGAGGGTECPPEGTCDTPSERNSWIPGPSTPFVTIRINFHVFCDNDGTNCASNPLQVAGQIAQLNSDFARYRIQFTESAEVEFIPNSAYRHLTDPEEAAMKNDYPDNPGHQLNVYVTGVDAFYVGKGTFPWRPYALGNLGGIIMDETVFGAAREALTHEVGHCLGLLHTHRGVSEVDPCSACYACSACYEPVSGVNRDTTGDFASDTPATPKNYTCEPPPGSDCDGASWGATQPENYMGYAGITDEACWTKFTAQQAGRMHCWIDDVLSGWIPFCDDNNGNSPLVCVDWSGALPPQRDQDFVLTPTVLTRISHQARVSCDLELAGGSCGSFFDSTRRTGTPDGLGRCSEGRGGGVFAAEIRDRRRPHLRPNRDLYTRGPAALTLSNAAGREAGGSSSGRCVGTRLDTESSPPDSPTPCEP